MKYRILSKSFSPLYIDTGKQEIAIESRGKSEQLIDEEERLSKEVRKYLKLGYIILLEEKTESMPSEPKPSASMQTKESKKQSSSKKK